MKKYIRTFKTALQESVMFRGRMLVWIVSSAIWIGVFPFVWLTAYGEKEQIAGFSRSMIVTYFFLLPIVESFVVYHTYETIHRDIKEGTITKYITKPLSYIQYMYWGETGWKFMRTGITFLLMMLVFPFIHSYITIPPVDITLLWIIPLLLISNIIGFLMAAIIGMVAFWTTEASSLKHFWWMLTSLAMGYIAPIEFFPSSVQNILALSPFPLLLHTPIQFLLDTLTSDELYYSFFLGSSWIIILLCINVILWKRGIKHFEGIGI